jgi:hypothetical protein
MVGQEGAVAAAELISRLGNRLNQLLNTGKSLFAGLSGLVRLVEHF